MPLNAFEMRINVVSTFVSLQWALSTRVNLEMAVPCDLKLSYNAVQTLSMSCMPMVADGLCLRSNVQDGGCQSNFSVCPTKVTLKTVES